MERGELLVAGRAVLRRNFQRPRQRGRTTEQLLIEPVAQPADGLGDQDGRRYRIEHRGKGDPAASGDQIAAEDTECDSPPDAKATLPDLQRVQWVPPGAEVELVIGDHVIQPSADDAERHANDDHHLHAVRRTASGLPPTPRDDHCDDDSGDYAQRVSAEGKDADVPDVRAGTGDGQNHLRPPGRHHTRPITPNFFPLPVFTTAT